jgi:uncharacterized protein
MMDEIRWRKDFKIILFFYDMIVFDSPGPENTSAIVSIVKKEASRCDYIVAASITGSSALQIAETSPGRPIICVTCPQGMYWEVDQMNHDLFATNPGLRSIRDEWIREGKKQVPMEITADNQKKLDALQIPVVKGTIPFFGPSFSIRLHLQQVTSLDIIAKTLELISPGTLVCLECVLMATDAGVIPEGVRVMACAGTERGLDTCWIIRSAASANLFHPERGARLIELLAKPGVAETPDISIEYLR